MIIHSFIALHRFPNGLNPNVHAVPELRNSVLLLSIISLWTTCTSQPISGPNPTWKTEKKVHMKIFMVLHDSCINNSHSILNSVTPARGKLCYKPIPRRSWEASYVLAHRDQVTSSLTRSFNWDQLSYKLNERKHSTGGGQGGCCWLWQVYEAIN